MNEPERRASIAVVLPNYNHGKLIGRHLRNLAGQTVPPDEIIVVDDASTDDSLPARSNSSGNRSRRCGSSATRAIWALTRR